MLLHSSRADILVDSWSIGKAAAFDLTVVSPLTVHNLSLAGEGDVVSDAESLKHRENDAKCHELGWTCIPPWASRAQAHVRELRFRRRSWIC